MRFIALSAVLALLGSAAHAQTPTAVDVATVSMTPAGVSRLVTNTICATDGRDLVADSDEAAHLFRYEVAQVFQSEAAQGFRSEAAHLRGYSFGSEGMMGWR